MTLEGLQEVPTETKLVVGVVSGSELINHSYLVLLPPILGLLAEEFEVSVALLGIAIGSRGAASAIFQLPFGYLSDRYTRTLGLGLSLGLGSLGTLLTAVAPSFIVLAIAQVIIGIGIAGHHPSHFPLLSDAVTEDQRARAFSIRGFAGSVGFGAPPAIITAVLSFPGTTWRHAVGALGVFGLLYGVLAVALFSRYVSADVTRPAPRDATADNSALTDRIASELRSIAEMPAILALAALAGITAIATGGVRTYAVIHLTQGYGASLEAANLTLTAMFVAGAIMMLVGGVLADRLPAGTVMLAGYALVGVLLIGLASLVIPTLVAMALVIGTQALVSVTGPARSKLIDKLSARTALGQSFAVMTVGLMLGGTIAPPLFGALIEYAGLRITFLVIALTAFLALLVAGAVVVTYDEEFSIRRPVHPADD
ncbi:MAG: MFS transporter [Halobacteriales archaeon]|nr:MFS transporter [Halobacteriales archaeon]